MVGIVLGMCRILFIYSHCGLRRESRMGAESTSGVQHILFDDAILGSSSSRTNKHEGCRDS